MNAHQQAKAFKAANRPTRRDIARAIPNDLLPLVLARAERDGVTVEAAYDAIIEASYAAQRKARERVEYEDPYGYGRGRY